MFSEFFIDGLGLLHVGSCDDVIVNHATKIKLPWGQSESDKAYAKFRYPPASSDATRTKNGLLYFKNRFQCLTHNWTPTSPSLYPSFCLPLPQDFSLFVSSWRESLRRLGVTWCRLRRHFPHSSVGKKIISLLLLEGPWHHSMLTDSWEITVTSLFVFVCLDDQWSDLFGFLFERL